MPPTCSKGKTWVRSYKRDDGTSVSGHCRTTVRGVIRSTQRKITQLKKLLMAAQRSIARLRKQIRMVKLPKQVVQRTMYLLHLTKPVSLLKMVQMMADEIQSLRYERDQLKYQTLLAVKLGAGPTEISSSKQNLNQLDGRLAELQQALDDIKMRQELYTNKDEMPERLISIERKLDNMISSKQNDVNQTTQHVEALKQSLARNAELDLRIQALQHENATLSARMARLSELDGENQVLAERLAKMEISSASTEDIKAQLAENRTQIKALNATITQQLADLQGKDMERDAMKDRIKTLEDEITTCKDTVSDTLAKFTILQQANEHAKQIEDSKNECEASHAALLIQLEDTIRDKNKVTSELHESIADLEARLASNPKPQEMADLREEISNMKTDFAEKTALSKAQIATLQDEKKALTEQIEALREQHVDAQEKVRLAEDAMKDTTELDETKRKQKEAELALEQARVELIMKEAGWVAKLQEKDNAYEQVKSTSKVELDTANEKISTLISERDAKQGNLDIANEKISVLTSERDFKQGELDIANKMIETLTSERNAKQGELDALNLTLNNDNDTNKKELSIKQGELNEANQKITNLIIERDAKQDELNVSNETITNLTQDRDAKQIELVDAKEKIANLTQDRDSKQVELVDAKEKITNLTQDRDAKQVEIDTIKSDRDAKQVDANEKITNLTQDRDTKQVEIDTVKAERDAKLAIITGLKDDINRLKEQQTQTANEALTSAQSSLSKKEAEILDLQAKLVDFEKNAAMILMLQREKSDLQVSLDQLGASTSVEKEELTKKIETVKQELQDKSDAFTRYQNEHDQLISELRTKHKEDMKILQESLASKQNDLDEKQRALDKVKQEKDELIEQRTKQDGEVLTRLNASLAEEVKRVEELTATISTRDHTIKELNEKLAANEKLFIEHDSLLKQCESLKNTHTELNTTLSEKETELAQLRTSDTVSKQEISDKKAEISQLRSEVESMKQQLTLLQKAAEVSAANVDKKEAQMQVIAEKLEKHDAEFATKEEEYKKQLEVKDNVIQQRTGELDTSKRMLTQAIGQIEQAASFLENTAYKKLASDLRSNLEDIKLERQPMNASMSLENAPSTFTESTLVVQSDDEVKNQYKFILEELVKVEEYYFKLVTSMDTFVSDEAREKVRTQLVENKYIVHADDSTDVSLTPPLKAYRQDTFSLYSFLATALFQLTKTFVRLPTVLRILSGNELDGISQANHTIRDNIIHAMYINVSTLFNNDAVLSSSKTKLYNDFMSMKQKEMGNVRIDIVAYYLLQFISKNNLYSTKTTKTDFNNLLSSFYMVCTTIIEQLKTIYYAVNNATISELDAITTKDGVKMREFHNNKNPVITLVKLRMDGGKYINRRFRVHPLRQEDSETQIMHMEYCDFDYRKGYGQGDKGNHEYQANGFPFYDKFGNEACDGFGASSGLGESIIPYNSDMYFGPFSRIYTPDMSNSDIVNDLTFTKSIESRLLASKPVCIIGYGSSGSGKTSTMVYYKPDDPDEKPQDGILTLLSNRLAEKYDRVKIKVYEFEGNIHSNKPAEDYLIRKFPPEVVDMPLPGTNKNVKVYDKPYEKVKRGISKEEEDERLDPTKASETSFEYVIGRVDGNKTWVKADLGRYNRDGNSLVKESNLDKDGKLIPMATEIVDFMDTKRSIAATANNPVSSRSHVIIFITYESSKGTEPANLVLCDFAGVENKFDCTSPSTLNKLGSIPIKGSDNKGTDGIPFYESQTGTMKTAKYNQYFKDHGKEMDDLDAFDTTLAFNINWLMHELETNPLPTNDVVDSKTGVVLQMGAKTIEKIYQSRYPASEMVTPLEFLSRISMLNDIKKGVQKAVDEYVAKITSVPTMKNGGFRIRKDESNYNKSVATAKKVQKRLNEIFLVHSTVIAPVTIPIGETSIVPIFQPDDEKIPTLLTKIKAVLSLSKQLSIKDDATGTTIGPIGTYVDDANTNSWLNDFLTILTAYGAELFTSYPDESARKNGLQVMQYAFEYGIIGNKTYSQEYTTVSDSLPNFMESVCKDRVKEGLYINNSLTELRSFISSIVQVNAKGFPPFIDQCAPLQCNPSYKTCFGINPYESPKQDTGGLPSVSSSLAEQIRKVPHSDEITFCILCVVNLSKTSANNPPVSPYINITSLVAEYERLRMVEDQFFMNKESMTKAIGQVVNGQILTNSFRINPDVLNDLMNHRLLDTPLDDTFVRDVKNACVALSKRIVTEPGFLDEVKALIDKIYNSNAITTIGTLEFTDTMAKFGSNSVTCTMSYDKITDQQVDTFLSNVNGYGTDVVYNGLEKLVKRQVITAEQMAEELSAFPPPKNNKPLIVTKPAPTPIIPQLNNISDPWSIVLDAIDISKNQLAALPILTRIQVPLSELPSGSVDKWPIKLTKKGVQDYLEYAKSRAIKRTATKMLDSLRDNGFVINGKTYTYDFTNKTWNVL